MKLSKAERKRQQRLRFKWCGELCATCAYRPGTEASREEGDPGLTRVRLALLRNCQPFYCHEDPPRSLRDKRRKACAGHMDALQALGRSGHEPTDTDRAELRAAYRNLDCQRAITDAMDGVRPKAEAL